MRLCGRAVRQASGSPDRASTLIDGLSLSAEDHQELMVEMATAGVEHQLAWAQWLVDSSSSSEQAMTNVRRFTSKWSQEELNGPAKWIDSLERGPLKDAALESFASVVWSLDQEGAHAWVQQMSDVARKEALLAKLAAN